VWSRCCQKNRKRKHGSFRHRSDGDDRNDVCRKGIWIATPKSIHTRDAITIWRNFESCDRCNGFSGYKQCGGCLVQTGGRRRTMSTHGVLQPMRMRGGAPISESTTNRGVDARVASKSADTEPGLYRRRRNPRVAHRIQDVCIHSCHDSRQRIHLRVRQTRFVATGRRVVVAAGRRQGGAHAHSRSLFLADRNGIVDQSDAQPNLFRRQRHLLHPLAVGHYLCHCKHFGGNRSVMLLATKEKKRKRARRLLFFENKKKLTAGYIICYFFCTKKIAFASTQCKWKRKSMASFNVSVTCEEY
jgi:hypothetical protein